MHLSKPKNSSKNFNSFFKWTKRFVIGALCLTGFLGSSSFFADNEMEAGFYVPKTEMPVQVFDYEKPTHPLAASFNIGAIFGMFGLCPSFSPIYCVKLQEPIGGARTVTGANGVGLITSYIRIVYKYGASIIGVICVMVMVYSGIQMMFGGLSQGAQSQAKDRILQSILSLVLLFGSAALLKAVNPGFFG